MEASLSRTPYLLALLRNQKTLDTGFCFIISQLVCSFCAFLCWYLYSRNIGWMVKHLYLLIKWDHFVYCSVFMTKIAKGIIGFKLLPFLLIYYVLILCILALIVLICSLYCIFFIFFGYGSLPTDMELYYSLKPMEYSRNQIIFCSINC